MYGPPEYFRENRRAINVPIEPIVRNDDDRKTIFHLSNNSNEYETPQNSTPVPAPVFVPAPPTVNEAKGKASLRKEAVILQRVVHREMLEAEMQSFSMEFAKDVGYHRVVVYKFLADQLVKNQSVLTSYETLRDTYKDISLDISVLKESESRPPFQTEPTMFGTFLDHFLEHDSYSHNHYLQQIDISNYLPELLDHAGITFLAPNMLSNNIISESSCHGPTFYIGEKGIKTSLHYDRSCDVVNNPEIAENDPGKNNLFLQLSGKRKFILFPPHYHIDLYPSIGSTTPHVSESTTFLHTIPHDVDESAQHEYLLQSQYPKLANAWPARLEIILEAGDGLLIPARWWHYTEILEAGSALNWWFAMEENIEAKINQRLLEQTDAKNEPPPRKNHKNCLIS